MNEERAAAVARLRGDRGPEVFCCQPAVRCRIEKGSEMEL